MFLSASLLGRDSFTKDQGRTQQVCFHHLQRVWLHEVHGGDENGSDAENEGSDEDDPGDVGILGEMAYQQHRQSEADVVGWYQGAHLSAVHSELPLNWRHLSRDGIAGDEKEKRVV